MITGKLINPQIIKDSNGNPISFDQTLVISNGDVYERSEVNLPYSMSDADVEQFVIDKVQEKINQLNIIQDLQTTVQWDWPEGVE